MTLFLPRHLLKPLDVGAHVAQASTDRRVLSSRRPSLYFFYRLCSLSLFFFPSEFLISILRRCLFYFLTKEFLQSFELGAGEEKNRPNPLADVWSDDGRFSLGLHACVRLAHNEVTPAKETKPFF